MGWTEIREWMTALGTMGAAIIALWLGLRANWRTNLEDSRKAGLCAASVEYQLSGVQLVLASLVAQCTFQDLTADRNRSTLKAITTVNNRLGSVYKPSLEVLLGLSHLPNNCANRIAGAYDRMDYVARHASEFLSQTPARIGGVDLASRERLLDSWRDVLWAADEMLRIALVECQAAAKLAAPRPTHEELYGPDADE